MNHHYAPNTVRPTYIEGIALMTDPKCIWHANGASFPVSEFPVRKGEGDFDVARRLFRDRFAGEFGGQYTDPLILHSTSWRATEDKQAMLMTFVAVLIRPPGAEYVIDIAPQAVPFTPALLAAVPNALRHGGAEEPTVDELDVALHGARELARTLGHPSVRDLAIQVGPGLHAVRQLEDLRQTDAGTRADMYDELIGHLKGFQPGLAGYYDDEHRLLTQPVPAYVE